MRVISAIAIAMLLAGCATPYNGGKMGIMGGTDAQMITNDTARISARGNGYTDRARVQDFVMLKAAETTLEHGFTHFAIVSAADATRASTFSTPGIAQTSVYGRTAVTTFSGGGSETIIRPGEDVFVRFCKGACPGMLPADEIVSNLGARYYERR